MSEVTHKVEFSPNPRQKRFIESRAKADLFSSRMGEGKSTALAWSAFYHTRHNPGARWALVRDTWENMQATTMKTFFEWFPPGVFGDFAASKKTFTWAEGVGRGEVEFLGMDAPEDAAKLMSRELGGIGIDEPAPAIGSAGVDEMIFDIGMTRLRQPDMDWYGMKLAENNPDEAHWTYRRFVEDPGEGFMVWQPDSPENVGNLPANYYEQMRKTLSHRPDLIRRFVEGEFGFQSVGKAVTPQWNDRVHMTQGLYPMKGRPIYIGWDFGHNPTALLTQITPLGHWNILDAVVGDDTGAEELIVDMVIPLLRDRYKGMEIKHTGDPAGNQREQTSIKRTAVKIIKKNIGGTWVSGPSRTAERVEPLRSALGRTIAGRGMVQVDKQRAAPVWHALRGGWHYHIARTGVISADPVKNHPHSDVGDAMGYLAALLFPVRKVMGDKLAGKTPQEATFFKRPNSALIGGGKPGIIVPSHGSKLLLPR